MAKYGRTSRKSVKSAKRKMKRGKLKLGKSKKKVSSRKQVMEIGCFRVKDFND